MNPSRYRSQRFTPYFYSPVRVQIVYYKLLIITHILSAPVICSYHRERAPSMWRAILYMIKHTFSFFLHFLGKSTQKILCIKKPPMWLYPYKGFWTSALPKRIDWLSACAQCRTPKCDPCAPDSRPRIPHTPERVPERRHGHDFSWPQQSDCGISSLPQSTYPESRYSRGSRGNHYLNRSVPPPH